MRLSPLYFILEWDEFGSDGGGDDWGSNEDLYFDDWGVGSDLDSDSWLNDWDDSWAADFGSVEDQFNFDSTESSSAQMTFPDLDTPVSQTPPADAPVLANMAITAVDDQGAKDEWDDYAKASAGAAAKEAEARMMSSGGGSGYSGGAPMYNGMDGAPDFSSETIMDNGNSYTFSGNGQVSVTTSGGSNYTTTVGQDGSIGNIQGSFSNGSGFSISSSAANTFVNNFNSPGFGSGNTSGSSVTVSEPVATVNQDTEFGNLDAAIEHQQELGPVTPVLTEAEVYAELDKVSASSPEITNQPRVDSVTLDNGDRLIIKTDESGTTQMAGKVSAETGHVMVVQADGSQATFDANNKLISHEVQNANGSTTYTTYEDGKMTGARTVLANGVAIDQTPGSSMISIQTDTSDRAGFNQAFATAKGQGVGAFEWEGKTYHTGTAAEAAQFAKNYLANNPGLASKLSPEILQTLGSNVAESYNLARSQSAMDIVNNGTANVAGIDASTLNAGVAGATNTAIASQVKADTDYAANVAARENARFASTSPSSSTSTDSSSDSGMTYDALGNPVAGSEPVYSGGPSTILTNLGKLSEGSSQLYDLVIAKGVEFLESRTPAGSEPMTAMEALGAVMSAAVDSVQGTAQRMNANTDSKTELALVMTGAVLHTAYDSTVGAVERTWKVMNDPNATPVQVAAATAEFLGAVATVAGGVGLTKGVTTATAVSTDGLITAGKAGTSLVIDAAGGMMPDRVGIKSADELLGLANNGTVRLTDTATTLGRDAGAGRVEPTLDLNSTINLGAGSRVEPTLNLNSNLDVNVGSRVEPTLGGDVKVDLTTNSGSGRLSNNTDSMQIGNDGSIEFTPVAGAGDLQIVKSADRTPVSSGTTSVSSDVSAGSGSSLDRVSEVGVPSQEMLDKANSIRYSGSTRDGLTEMDPVYGQRPVGEQNLRGAGVYATSTPDNDVAVLYAGNKGTVYQIDPEVTIQKPFDVDSFYSAQDARAYLEASGMSAREASAAVGNGSRVSGETIYRQMTNASGGDKDLVNSILKDQMGHDMILYKIQGEQAGVFLNKVNVEPNFTPVDLRPKVSLDDLSLVDDPSLMPASNPKVIDLTGGSALRSADQMAGFNPDGTFNFGGNGGEVADISFPKLPDLGDGGLPKLPDVDGSGFPSIEYPTTTPKLTDVEINLVRQEINNSPVVDEAYSLALVNGQPNSAASIQLSRLENAAKDLEWSSVLIKNDGVHNASESALSSVQKYLVEADRMAIASGMKGDDLIQFRAAAADRANVFVADHLVGQELADAQALIVRAANGAENLDVASLTIRDAADHKGLQFAEVKPINNATSADVAAQINAVANRVDPLRSAHPDMADGFERTLGRLESADPVAATKTAQGLIDTLLDNAAKMNAEVKWITAEMEATDKFKTALGMWEPDTRTLWVRASATDSEKIAIMNHELHHAQSDFSGVVNNARESRIIPQTAQGDFALIEKNNAAGGYIVKGFAADELPRHVDTTNVLSAEIRRMLAGGTPDAEALANAGKMVGGIDGILKRQVELFKVNNQVLDSAEQYLQSNGHLLGDLITDSNVPDGKWLSVPVKYEVDGVKFEGVYRMTVSNDLLPSELKEVASRIVVAGRNDMADIARITERQASYRDELLAAGKDIQARLKSGEITPGGKPGELDFSRIKQEAFDPDATRPMINIRPAANAMEELEDAIIPIGRNVFEDSALVPAVKEGNISNEFLDRMREAGRNADTTVNSQKLEGMLADIKETPREQLVAKMEQNIASSKSVEDLQAEFDANKAKLVEGGLVLVNRDNIPGLRSKPINLYETPEAVWFGGEINGRIIMRDAALNDAVLGKATFDHEVLHYQNEAAGKAGNIPTDAGLSFKNDSAGNGAYEARFSGDEPSAHLVSGKSAIEMVDALIKDGKVGEAEVLLNHHALHSSYSSTDLGNRSLQEISTVKEALSSGKAMVDAQPASKFFGEMTGRDTQYSVRYQDAENAMKSIEVDLPNGVDPAQVPQLIGERLDAGLTHFKELQDAQKQLFQDIADRQEYIQILKNQEPAPASLVVEDQFRIVSNPPVEDFFGNSGLVADLRVGDNLPANPKAVTSVLLNPELSVNVELIGQGAKGSVYSIQNEGAENLVLKLPNSRLDRIHTQDEIAASEALSQAGIPHARIVDSAADGSFLIKEKVDGVGLDHLQNSLTDNHIQQLAAIYKASFENRVPIDVKASNFMVDEGGQILLVDTSYTQGARFAYMRGDIEPLWSNLFSNEADHARFQAAIKGGDIAPRSAGGAWEDIESMFDDEPKNRRGRRGA